MFLPEFTITTKVLNNIAKAEYARAVVENTTILPTWQAQLAKDAKTDTVFAGIQTENINLGYEVVKKYVYGLTSKTDIPQLTDFVETYNNALELAVNKDLQEQDIKFLARAIQNSSVPRSKQIGYRSITIPNRIRPEEVLAELTEFIDWLNTREAREEHPIVVAAITKFTILNISPIEQYNHWLSSLLCKLVLTSRTYSFKNWLSLEDVFFKDRDEIEVLTDEVGVNSDYTQILEYFSDQLADRAMNLGEQVKLLAKDTKIAKVSGRAKLSERQQNILAYLQDYGILQNKDFTALFPKISEDSVLRDLKALLDAGLIVKSGSTKSSRYELK
jgi:hypothetical protein